MRAELLKCNEFELFNLLPSFRVDLEILDQRYRNLQQQYHPDNFANQDIALYNQSLQLSALINSAYTTLKSPLLRSLCLLRLADLSLDLSHDTQLPMSFIVLQMETHEALDEAKMAKDINALESLEITIKLQQNELIKQLEVEFKNNNMFTVKELTKQLAFCNKLVANVSETINQLI